MMNKWKISFLIGGVCVFLAQCGKIKDDKVINEDGTTAFKLESPDHFPDFFRNPENPLSEEGVYLGKKLFFDPILSRNKNVSCGSCHLQQDAFSDSRRKSIGTHGEETTFHSMPLFNIAWMNEFFWNGRAKSREEQALKPVTNPLEMDLTWPEAVERLQNHKEYPFLFQLAFGTDQIDSTLVAKALVQYEMTLISADSKYDRYVRNEAYLSSMETWGLEIFMSEKGDCFHCHSNVNLTTDNGFHNNGLDSDENLQPGLYEVTGVEEDFGKFKTPTLRNLAFTAPYMHDGRYKTLDQVIDFYSDSVQNNRTVDVLMEHAYKGGVGLFPLEKEALKAFLLTLTDSTILTNPAYSNPNN